MTMFHSLSGRRRAAAVLVGATLASAVGPALATAATPAKPGLRTIHQRDLQSLLDRRARAMHIPGAVILLRTP